MNGKDKLFLIAGVVLLASSIILKLTGTVTVVQTSVILAVGFILFAHSLDYMKRAINDRDEFVRRVNQISMAKSWRLTQLLIVALLFATILHWITLSAIWVLFIVVMFMTATYVLFLVRMFLKGEVE